MKKNLKYIFLSVAFLLGAFLIYQLAINFTPDIQLLLNPQKSETELINNVRSHGLSTGILLVFLIIVMSAIPGLPTSVVGVLTGICYSPLIGSLMNIAGNALGNLILVYLMRIFKFMDKSRASNHWVQIISNAKHPKINITLAYMIPIIPSFLVSYTVNLLNIKASQIIVITLIGALPSSILYAFGGDALLKGNTTKAILLIASVVILIGLILILKKDWKRKEKVTLK